MWYTGFLGFANFYRQFIQGFSRFATPRIFILKIASVADLAVGDKQDSQEIQIENWDEKKPTQKNCKSQRTTKSKKWIWAKKAEASRAKNLVQSGMFFITNARKAFTKLRLPFIVAPILNYFDPECHIWIETDTLGYVISRILSQLTSDDLGR